MFVYLWENKVNGKKYVGRHAGKPTSTYKGSGKYFRRALNKFGEANFTRTILKECRTIDECKKWEQYYLDKFDAANSPEFYNISPSANGGHHGADHSGKNNPMWGKKHPNHVPHIGEANGMYGVRRPGSENPNAKPVRLIDPSGTEHKYNCLKEACVTLFGDDKDYGKLKHLITQTRENIKIRSTSRFYGWRAYYE